MKLSTILVFLALFLSRSILPAQPPCTPDPGLTTPGTFPDSAATWFGGTQNWDEEIYFTFRTDTVIFGFTLPYDSVRFDSIGNIPPGFPNFIPPPTNTSFPQVPAPGGLYQACMYIDGSTPSGSYNPSWPDQDSIIAYFKVFHFADLGPNYTVFHRYYYFRWSPTVGLESGASIKPIEIVPNPVVDRAKIRIERTIGEIGYLELLDQRGKVIRSWTTEMLEDQNGEVELDGNGLARGMYFLRYGNAEKRASRKILIF